MRARLPTFLFVLRLALVAGCGAPGEGPREGSGGARDDAAAPAPTEESAPSPEPERASSSEGALPASAARRIEEAVMGAVARREIPGAVVLVVAGSGVVYHEAHGLSRLEPTLSPMRRDTVFDLASLTKPIATATSIALLAERGLLRFGDPASKHLPELAANGKSAVTIEELLLHTSGLPADNALSDYRGSRAESLSRVMGLPFVAAPGEKFVYSDVGYIVLGEVVSRVTKKALDELASEALFGPLGMKSTAFSPGPALLARAAPTERLGENLLTGVVHDPRARALGGVAGHAGLFGTAADLGLFARMLLQGGRSVRPAPGASEGASARGEAARGEARILGEGTVRALLSPRSIPGGQRAYLGSVSGGAVSHTGFTGTLLWVDPARKIAVVVLSNRVHPDGKGSADRLRREVLLAAVAAATDARKAERTAMTTASPTVKTGIDALAQGGFRELGGRRAALLTHAAGRSLAGERTADILAKAPGVTLVSLLSPEHGLGSSEDGAVADAVDAKTGLPVYSLYGKNRRPTKAMLAGADTLVVDLQDAGARFYTYAATLSYALEAAADLGVRVVVLDRPNPTGGERVEGPSLDPGKESFVAFHDVPVRHGMTLGEIAKMLVAERKLAADLVVVPMKGWRREALFEDTGLAWTPPSPNLRTPAAALLYPGIGLLETTNLSVGRGTARPFEQIGAPWLDAGGLVTALRDANLAGVSFTEVTFTPRSSTFAGELCRGVAISITRRSEVASVRLGLAIAVALRKIHGAEWRASGMATLLGHEETLSAIVAGHGLSGVTAELERETAAFLERRKPFLLY